MKDPSGARLWNLPMRLQSDAPQVPLKTSAIRLVAHGNFRGCLSTSLTNDSPNLYKYSSAYWLLANSDSSRQT